MILNTKEKINFLKALPEYSEIRLNQINNKINSTNDLQLHIILQIGIAMNHYVKSLVTSLETANILAANVLFRSMVESFINIEYIMQDESPLRSIAYLFLDFKTQQINIETFKELIEKDPNQANLIPELSTIEKCNEQLNKLEHEKSIILKTLKTDFKIEVNSEDLNFLTLEQRANKINLRNLYNVLYRYLCGISHMSASGLKELIKFENDRYLIATIDTEEEIHKILTIAYDIYLLSIKDLFMKFDIYIEKDFKIMEEISEKLKSKNTK